MADCLNAVYSNDYYDFIISYDEITEVGVSPECVQMIAEEYDTFYYPRADAPMLQIATYTYGAIPKCYGLLDQTALEASGIIRIQNQPTLSLKGQGVCVGFIDTGVDYSNPVFRYSDGSSRIYRIWDQTIPGDTPPDGFIYGTEYTREQLNEALASENPQELVPTTDTNGHGTFLAGVACGSENSSGQFIGAAPESEIVVVKLKEAKQYLRDFYFISQDALAYQENDIMSGIAYLNRIAELRNMPLVICLALGNNMGSHGKDGPLSSYLNYICTKRKRVGITATGNEANSRHHFQGQMEPDMLYEDVEISVEEDMPGFFIELWSKAPELYAISVISPTGEIVPKIPARTNASEVLTFLFENTTVAVDYRIVGREIGNQLIYIRLENVVRGIWKIRVFPESIVTGIFDMWLPMKQLTQGNVFFLRSNPDVTLTVPGTARQPITVGGYAVANRSIYVDSGRGYNLSGDVKPDFVAPAVNVYGPGLRNTFINFTGTSAAAAITAGAAAQLLEWAVVQQNDPQVSTAEIKNILIRGAGRSVDRVYPNREWGYGTLDLYNSFLRLRG